MTRAEKIIHTAILILCAAAAGFQVAHKDWGSSASTVVAMALLIVAGNITSRRRRSDMRAWNKVHSETFTMPSGEVITNLSTDEKAMIERLNHDLDTAIKRSE